MKMGKISKLEKKWRLLLCRLQLPSVMLPSHSFTECPDQLALFHVPHGISNAMLLPGVLEFTKESAIEKLATIGRIISPIPPHYLTLN
ncbi:hypothetical protein UACE39S_05093 [Ureibacillus acetophenoni]